MTYLRLVVGAKGQRVFGPLQALHLQATAPSSAASVKKTSSSRRLDALRSLSSVASAQFFTIQKKTIFTHHCSYFVNLCCHLTVRSGFHFFDKIQPLCLQYLAPVFLYLGCRTMHFVIATFFISNQVYSQMHETQCICYEFVNLKRKNIFILL